MKSQSGLSAEPTRSWHCAALISMVVLRIIGKSVGRLGWLDTHFYVASHTQFTFLVSSPVESAFSA